MKTDFTIHADEIDAMAAAIQEAWRRDDSASSGASHYEGDGVQYSERDYQVAVRRWLAEKRQDWLDYPNEVAGKGVHDLLYHTCDLCETEAAPNDIFCAHHRRLEDAKPALVKPAPLRFQALYPDRRDWEDLDEETARRWLAGSYYNVDDAIEAARAGLPLSTATGTAIRIAGR